MEAKLLAAFLQSHEALKQLLSTINHTPANFSDQGQIIFDAIQAFYENDPEASSVDKELLLEKLEARLNNDKQFERFKAIIDDFEEVSVPNVIDAYLEHCRTEVRLELSTALLQEQKDKKVRDLIDRWEALADGYFAEDVEETEVYEDVAVADILGITERKNLIPIYPHALNEKIDGGAVKGDHIVIAGRVEEGKSLFAINMACGFCRDGYRVLYVGNEDSPQRMLPRFLSRMSGLTKFELAREPEEAERIARSKGWENLIFASIPSGTFSQIEGLIDNHNPDIVIVDQLRNLSVGIEDGVQQLEKAAKGMRRIIKKHNILGISITQSNNDEARINKLVNEMCDVDSSNVGIPGQADLMIMLGSNEDFRNKNRRMINIPKNKMSGYHGYFPVSIDPALSKVRSI